MPKQRTKVVVFHCPEDLHAALMDLAATVGEPASVLLRRATRDLVRAGGEAGRTEESEA